MTVLTEQIDHNPQQHTFSITPRFYHENGSRNSYFLGLRLESGRYSVLTGVSGSGARFRFVWLSSNSSRMFRRSSVIIMALSLGLSIYLLKKGLQAE
jgi:hypothetical protein